MTDNTDRIVDLLRHGPLTREAIANRLKLDLGTVYVLLVARKCFVRHDDGKWTFRKA